MVGGSMIQKNWMTKDSRNGGPYDERDATDASSNAISEPTLMNVQSVTLMMFTSGRALRKASSLRGVVALSLEWSTLQIF
jgi:hypothetical protein